jgi:hypothetical protein
MMRRGEMMEEGLTIMMGVCTDEDVSFDRHSSFFGDLRDTYALVKRLALGQQESTKYLFSMGENEEGLPVAEFREGKELRKTIFATRKYETHNWTIMGEML